MNKIRVGILGAMGRMGRSNLTEVVNDQQLILQSAVEVNTYPSLGNKISHMLSDIGPCSITLSDNLNAALLESDVIIDFTNPQTTLNALEKNVHTKKAFVIGTTGFNHSQMELIQEFSQQFSIVLASNFSLGMNVLFVTLKKLASLLNKEKNYDIEIIESHHRFKKDAPSGTAMQLAKLAATHSGRNPETDLRFERHGIIGERSLDEIGVLAIRQGDVVGEHSIQFSTLGEQVHIGHRASSRQAFSKGAIFAAKWIADKRYGLFSMQDVLQLKN